MRDLHLGIDITGNNRDFLRAIGGSIAGMRALDGEQRRVASSTRGVESRTRALNSELNKSNVHLKAYARNLGTINGLQRSVFAPVILGSLSAMTAGLNSLAAASGVAAISAGRLATVMGTGMLAAMMAAKQGALVWGLALKGVSKALTTVGDAHQKAMAQLSKPAREFVKTIEGLKVSYAEMQLIAQKGLFPGLEAGLRKALVLLPVMKQAIYDTAKVLGFLGNSLGGMLGSHKSDISSILERNVVTLRRMGEAAINFGSAFIGVWKAAGPVVGRMSRDLVTVSKHVDEFFNSSKGQASAKKFFDSLRMSWSQYSHTALNVFEGFRNIVKDALPEANRFDTMIAQIGRHFREWTDKNGKNISSWFHGLMPDAKELGKLVGGIVVALGKIGADPQAQNNFKRIADGLRTGVLPILVEVSNSFNRNVLPGLLDVAGALTHLVKDALPGLHILGETLGNLLTHVVAPLVNRLDDIVKFAGQFGSIGSVIGAGLSVAGVLIGWQTLAREMQLVRTLGRQIGGTIPRGTITRRDFVEAVPGLGARGVGTAAGINSAREQAGLAPRSGGGAVFAAPALRGGGGGSNISRGATVVIPAGSSEVISVSRASDIYQRGGNTGFGYGVPQVVPSGIPYRTRGGRVVMTGQQTGREIGATSTLAGNTVVSRRASLSAGDRVYNSLYGTGEPIVGPSRLSRIGSGFKTFGAGASPILKGGAYGLLAALMLGISPASIYRGVAGKTQKYNLPTFNFAEKNIPIYGAAEKFITGGPSDSKLKLFGNTAESAFKKLEGAHNFKGLSQLAQQARDMAREYPKASRALLTFAGDVQKAATGVGDQFDAMKNASGFSMQFIKDTVASTTASIKYRLGNDTAKGKDAMAKNFSIAMQDIKDSMNQGTVFTKDGLAEIRKLMSQELAMYGIKGAQAASYLTGLHRTQNGTQTPAGAFHQGDPGSGAPRKARGGYIPIGKPGSPGTDRVPLMLNGQPIIAAEGEAAAVFTRHQQGKLGQMVGAFGYSSLGDFFTKNNKPNYMARGGLVTGDTDYLPALGSDLNRMASSTNTPIYVASGRRTMAEQSALYNKYKGSRPVAFPSPNAPHVRGIAADISPGRETFGGVAGKFGMGFTVPAESWHIQLLNAAAARAGSAATSVGRFSVDGLGGIGGIVQSGLNTSASLADSLIAQISAMSNGVSGETIPNIGKGAWQSVEAAIAKSKGWNLGDWNWLIGAESGGDPTAHNPTSGAFGIGQFLGATAQKYAKFGALSPNPIMQIRAMAQYISDRYGNPTRAKAFHLVHNWYSQGGILRASAGQPPIPGRGGGVPSVNPGDAVGPGNKPKAKKPKAKKTAPVYPKGSRPSGTPFGSYLLHGKARKAPKISARTRAAKKLGGGRFDFADLGILRDPITGEDLGVDSLKMLHPLVSLVNSLPGIDNAFQNAQSAFGVTNEDQTTTLYDSAQYPDLTNYLKGHPQVLGGLTPEAWKAQFGDSLDVPNTAQNGPPFGPAAGDGLTVQGIFDRGIGAHLAELAQLLGMRIGNPPGFANGKYQRGSGMLNTLLMIKGMRNTLLPNGVAEKAIAERRERLHKLKIMFDKNVAVRKAMKKKMSNIKSRGYGWQTAVHDNEDLLAKWRDYKRSGDHLPKPFRDSIDNNIARIEATNRALRFKKPKGGDGYTLGVLQSEYDDAGRANNYMVGRDNAEVWSLSGGRAQAISMSLDVWDAIKQYRNDLDSNTLSQIPTEQNVTIPTMQSEYNDWAGTRITPFNVGSGSSGSSTNTQLSDLLAQQNDLLRAQSSINSNYGNVFKGFAPLLAGRLVGSFDHGGVIPQTGYALVHKGEYISPNPEGPYRRGMNAPASTTYSPSITLVLQGDAASLVDVVDARIDGRAAPVTSRKVGRKSRLLSAAPGGGR